jgi:hypothetical protein
MLASVPQPAYEQPQHMRVTNTVILLRNGKRRASIVDFHSLVTAGHFSSFQNASEW